MPLDFAVIDHTGRPSAFVAVGLTLWDAIASVAVDDREFPLLSRMHDYYRDAAFGAEEVPSLAAELERALVALPASRAEISRMLELCRVADAQGARMMAIAD